LFARPSTSFAKARWFYGVPCARCGQFITIAPTPTGAWTEQAYAMAGSLIARCRKCGHRDVYSCRRIEQLAADAGHAGER
jgi:hypothetical protein